MSIRTSVAAFASLAVLLLLPAAAAAQSNEPSHAAMYVEAGGSGLLYSVNYEARLVGMVNGRIGFMAVNQPVNDGTSQIDVGVLLVPVMANVLVGSGSHRLELGAGPLLGVAGTGVNRLSRGGAHVSVQDFQVSGLTSAIGYRYHPVSGGFLFRATATPFYSGSEAQVWGGISIGWAM